MLWWLVCHCLVLCGFSWPHYSRVHFSLLLCPFSLDLSGSRVSGSLRQHGLCPDGSLILHPFLSPVKINKGKTSLKRSQDVHTLHVGQEVTLVCYHQQEEEKFSTCLATAEPMRVSHNSAKEKPLYCKLPVSSNGLFVYSSPSQLSLSSIKEFPLLCLRGLACGSP